MRLFVALYPPISCALEMLQCLDSLAPSGQPVPPHRATPPDQIHLTIQFIGERTPKELDDAIESVARSASGLGPFRLTPRRLCVLPENGPARLIAIETDAPPQLIEIQRRLAHRLARRPRSDPADRFTPHLTLARLRPESAEFRLDAQVGNSVTPFDVLDVALMRSVVRPGGAEHREVFRVAL